MAFFSPNYTGIQKTQLSLDNNQAMQQFGQAGNIYNQIDPALQNILNNPGYTPQQISAMTTGTLQPISNIYGSGQAALGRQAGASRNSAGLASGEDSLARSALGSLGTANANLQTNIANRPRQQTFEALSGLQNLYNPTLQAGTNLYGQATNIANNPKSPSYAQDVGSAIGLAGDAASAGLAGSNALFQAGYAKGGPVKKGKPILVGERGPEEFVPPSKGRIVPNNKLKNLYAAA